MKDDEQKYIKTASKLLFFEEKNIKAKKLIRETRDGCPYFSFFYHNKTHFLGEKYN
jgi:hypothetical protein